MATKVNSKRAGRAFVQEVMKFLKEMQNGCVHIHYQRCWQVSLAARENR